MVRDIVVVNGDCVFVVKLDRLDSDLHEFAVEHQFAILLLVQVLQLVNAVLLAGFIDLRLDYLLKAALRATLTPRLVLPRFLQSTDFVKLDTLK